jgi:hypothetical protein
VSDKLTELFIDALFKLLLECLGEDLDWRLNFLRTGVAECGLHPVDEFFGRLCIEFDPPVLQPLFPVRFIERIARQKIVSVTLFDVAGHRLPVLGLISSLTFKSFGDCGPENEA